MENQKMEIAVLDGRTIRKFINRMTKLGASIKVDQPTLKVIEDGRGGRIFSALKYSSGWDCRVASAFVSELKSCF